MRRICQLRDAAAGLLQILRPGTVARNGKPTVMNDEVLNWRRVRSHTPVQACDPVRGNRNVNSASGCGHEVPRASFCQTVHNRQAPPWIGIVLLLAVICCVSGCASTKVYRAPRKFEFSKDTFAYANQLVWEYGNDAQGHWTTRRREPPPDYSLHCFVVARSALQFFENARFDPQQPRADEAGYRRLVQLVVTTNPRKPRSPEQAIVIPGYPDLRSFSKEHETLLKQECGGAWQCYFQRGNWRMIFPFTRHEQRSMAQRIVARLNEDNPVLVHLVRFPQLSINHTVLIYGVKQQGTSLEFEVYDPNASNSPATLNFDCSTNTFVAPPVAYFRGGRVDVYEICHRWDY